MDMSWGREIKVQGPRSGSMLGKNKEAREPAWETAQGTHRTRPEKPQQRVGILF